jgi:hypothetical protein
MLRKYRRDREIEGALEILPQDLDKTYERIVDQIEKQEPQLQLLAQKILTWVFYATRPLSIEELVDAVAIDDTCLTRRDLDSNAYPEEAIFEACANLLTQEMSSVRPIHYTVQEFFMKPRNNSSSTTLNCTANRNLAYTHLTNCCIRYLMLNSVADTPCDDGEDLQNRLHINPLVAHSAYAFDHYFVRLDNVSPDLQQNLNNLLLGSKQSLASILQLRKLRDNSEWGNILASFSPFPDDIFPEDIIYATALFNSAQLLSINDRWKDLKAPQYALHRAAGAGIVDAILPLIKAEQDVRGEDTHRLTPLYYACEGGYVEICRLLIKFGANINAQGGYYGNALQAAFGKGHEAVMKILIEKGANVNAQNGYYGNALQATSERGYEAIVKLLIEKGANVNAQGGYYGNALQAASGGGHEAVVKLLVEKGADVNAQGGYYGNALQAASEGGHEAVVKLLIEKGADINAQGGTYGNALQTASLVCYEARNIWE